MSSVIEQIADILDLIDDLLKQQTVDMDKRIIAKRIIRHCVESAGLVEKQTEPDKEMSEEQARQFEQTLMPFGVNKGYKIVTVELPYLVWLAETNEFVEQLNKYLKRPEIQERIERET